MKTKNQKGFVFVELVIILLVFGTLAVIGTRYWQARQLAQVKELPVKNPGKTDPYAGWKTYENSKYGFSFKYPPSWMPSGFNDSVGFPSGFVDGAGSVCVQINLCPVDYQIYSGSPEHSIDEFKAANNFEASHVTGTVSDLGHNGLLGKRLTWKSGDLRYSNFGYFYGVDSRTYTISNENLDKYPRYYAQAIKVLDSFSQDSATAKP